MKLPKRAENIIKDFVRPLTRPDWKTNPKFSFNQLFYGLKKQNKFIIMRLYYNVVKGICHYYLCKKYHLMLDKGYTKYDILLEIEKEFGLEPRLTMLMCNI